jgi:sugar phosphate isomerase/epimerase
VDTGNNISLLEDPMEVIQTLAPWAYSVHLKDMAVEEYEEGFLLSEVPFGEGVLDLKKVVAVLRQARPEVRFNVEMITRDPLRVPCLTPKYWATFENLPGRHLARTLTWVRRNKPPQPLPRVSGLAPERQRELEEENVRKCLAYAGKQLGM